MIRYDTPLSVSVVPLVFQEKHSVTMLSRSLALDLSVCMVGSTALNFFLSVALFFHLSPFFYLLSSFHSPLPNLSVFMGDLSFSGLPQTARDTLPLSPCHHSVLQSCRGVSLPIVLITIHLQLYETPLFLLRPLNVWHILCGFLVILIG